MTRSRERASNSAIYHSLRSASSARSKLAGGRNDKGFPLNQWLQRQKRVNNPAGIATILFGCAPL
jgi:hypothetical protein